MWIRRIIPDRFAAAAPYLLIAVCAVPAVLFIAGGGSAGSGELPVTLDDPVSQRQVKVGPGAPLLHVVFFATWCPPCLEELDRLSDLRDRWSEHGYRLVLVAVQARHTPERLARFAGERKLPGDLLFDSNGRVAKGLQADGLPTHLLYDEAGRRLLRAASLNDGVEARVEELFSDRARTAE
jgi:peroxiredoxin